MAKRKDPSGPTQTTKRPRQEKPTIALSGTKSVLEQAKPYLLTTAKVPIGVLTTVWKVGKNRRVDNKHAQRLCQIFKEQGLQREQDKNHLRIACTQAEVSQMQAHLHSAEHPSLSSQWLDFRDWEAVNGTKIEIMAGQHRVEALKLFLEFMSDQSQGQSFKEEEWWICDIYDIGELVAMHF
jgi:hypothetical protein